MEIEFQEEKKKKKKEALTALKTPEQCASPRRRPFEARPAGADQDWLFTRIMEALILLRAP